MPTFRRWSLKYSVNEDFFDHWSGQMAYLLGFTFADGSIYKTSLSWDIQKRDLDLLEKINKIINSTYPISVRKRSCRLRISNQIFIRGAVKRGLVPKKNMRDELPKIPERFIRHFVRGFLDGDGWIIIRTGRNEIDIGFSSGNNDILEILSSLIYRELGILGKVRTKDKITPRGIRAITRQLEYYCLNAVELADWLYGGLTTKDLYLKRKYYKYLKAKEIYNLSCKKFKGKRRIQKELGKSLKDILFGLYRNMGLNGMQITKILGTSKSSVYRWLESTGVKYSK